MIMRILRSSRSRCCFRQMHCLFHQRNHIDLNSHFLFEFRIEGFPKFAGHFFEMVYERILRSTKLWGSFVFILKMIPVLIMAYFLLLYPRLHFFFSLLTLLPKYFKERTLFSLRRNLQERPWRRKLFSSSTSPFSSTPYVSSLRFWIGIQQRIIYRESLRCFWIGKITFYSLEVEWIFQQDL